MPRDESKVQEAERIVLSRAVQFAEALGYYEFTLSFHRKGEVEPYLSQVKKVEDDLRAAVASLLAAEAAS